MKPLVELRGVSKEFRWGGEVLHVLRGVSLSIAPRESVAVTGPSGSGKSTLLGLMAGLERPSAGSIRVDGRELSELDEDGLAELRRRRIGFVFQGFRLVPRLTAQENVALPLELLGWKAADAMARAAEALKGLDLGRRLSHLPSRLSGGEQQRTAIARAFVHEPALILADEPTGSVDREHAGRVLDALLGLTRERGAALVLVTHDPAVAARLGRTFALADGRAVAAEP